MCPARNVSASCNRVHQPLPLKIPKESHLIQKPAAKPISPSHHSNGNGGQEQRSGPTICHSHDPEVFRTEPCHFIDLVQLLTGMDPEVDQEKEDLKATDNRPSSDVPAQPPHDAGVEPPVRCNNVAANAPMTGPVGVSGSFDLPFPALPFPLSITGNNVMMPLEQYSFTNMQAPFLPVQPQSMTSLSLPNPTLTSNLPDLSLFLPNPPYFTGGFSPTQSNIDAMFTDP